MAVFIIIDDPHIPTGGSLFPWGNYIVDIIDTWNRVDVRVQKAIEALGELRDELDLGIKRWLKAAAPLWVLFEEFERQTMLAALFSRRPRINLLFAPRWWRQRARPRQVHHGSVLLNFCKVRT